MSAQYTLPGALSPLAEYKQFILVQFVPRPGDHGKTDKLPINPHTFQTHDAHDPAIWMSCAEASNLANSLGQGWGVGFVITAADPFVCLDLDECAASAGGWIPEVQTMLQAFPGAVELSNSGRGLHVWSFYSGVCPPHGKKSKGTLDRKWLELYSELRFIALGSSATGAMQDVTAILPGVIAQYFPQSETDDETGGAWTTGPVSDYTPLDDDELFRRAHASTRKQDAAAVFGGAAPLPCFTDLWTRDMSVLARAYPAQMPGKDLNGSDADFALAKELAYWTGKDCERIQRLMLRSALRRDKWEYHRKYLRTTILEAVAMCQAVYHVRPNFSAMGPFVEPLLPTCDARDGTGNTRALTELGNALRLFDAYGEVVRFVNDVKAWIVWFGAAWQWDIDGARVRSLAAGLSKVIYGEGAKHINDADHFGKWARKSQEQRTIKAAVSLLADRNEVRLPLACVDADQFAIGFNHARQIIDLHNGTTRPATPSDYITKSLNAEIIGDAAKAVRWVQFLEQIFDGDRELIDWIQRFTGYVLTGSTQESIFLFCFGHGANGKSVFIEVLKYIMGDYARAIASETLGDSKRQAGGATPDLAVLIGARLVTSSETEDNTAMAESLVKSLVAGDSMAVRQLQCAPTQFTPNCKLVMAGNHKPMVKGTDDGIWRRVRLVPFNRTFAADEQDRRLLDKLKDEAPHILAWMVAGCIEWLRRPLTDTPTVIRQATADYRVDQDIIGRYLEERTLSSAQDETLGNILYADYSAWCAQNGFKPSSSAVFGRRLAERGYKVRKSNGKNFWCGLICTNLAARAFT